MIYERHCRLSGIVVDLKQTDKENFPFKDCTIDETVTLMKNT